MNLIVVVVVPTPLLLLLLFHVPNTQVVAPRSHDAGHNWPETETCEIHLVSLGLRYLEPFGMGDVTNPAYHILAPNFPNRNARRKHLHDLLPVDGGSTDNTKKIIEKYTQERFSKMSEFKELQKNKKDICIDFFKIF